jgi:flavin reductase (DIM6/NTAB) family NADH-FMN oxidoreductase RutF
MSLATSKAVLDSVTYRSIFRSHPAGVAIVTLEGPGGPVGFTATSVASVSAEPPVIVFSMIDISSSWPAVSHADTVLLHFLNVGHSDLSKRFATSGIDRFEGVEWRRLATGEPLLSGVDTWARCAVLRYDRAGSSFIVQVQPLEAQIGQEHHPLVYVDRRYHRLNNHSVIGK